MRVKMFLQKEFCPILLLGLISMQVTVKNSQDRVLEAKAKFFCRVQLVIRRWAERCRVQNGSCKIQIKLISNFCFLPKEANLVNSGRLPIYGGSEKFEFIRIFFVAFTRCKPRTPKIKTKKLGYLVNSGCLDVWRI